MQQFVLCKGCGNQLHEPPCMGECPIPQSVRCENCGLETICEDGTIEEAEQYEESKKEPLELPQLELEIDLEPETDEPQRSPDWSVLGPNIRRQRPREVSAIRKIIPPVLGGLAAFPIATLIMWYGFGRDIGTAGPAVAEYVPWIVPETLRNYPPGYSVQESSRSGNRLRPNTLPRKDFPNLGSENSIVVRSESSANKVDSRLRVETNDSTSKSIADEPITSEKIYCITVNLYSVESSLYPAPIADLC